METVVCNLCGSDQYAPVYSMPDRLFFREEFFTVVECRRCGLGFLNPRPTPAEMATHYPAEYFRLPSGSSNARYMERRFRREASYLASVERSTAAGARRLLDVGCATGAFPRFMAKRGWQVEGVEIAEVAASITDLPVHTQEFQNIPVNEPTYDAVTAWAVLEHVHDPMAYFRKASTVLKRGGLFVFLVPNFASLASRNLFCEDIPRHIYFFSRETVRRYLEQNEFALEREDNGRGVYKLAPHNWLGYQLRTHLLRKSYSFPDVPLTSKEFRRIHNLPGGFSTAMKYAAYSPVSVIDRMLWPVIETAQILLKRYGVSTYVARKI